MAVSGDKIVVGASADGRHNAAGAAYVFVKPAGGWASETEAAKLTASDGAASTLGNSVAVSGDTVVAGAPSATVNGNIEQGAAYVFVKPAGGWANETEAAKLTASDGAAATSSAGRWGCPAARSWPARPTRGLGTIDRGRRTCSSSPRAAGRARPRRPS